MRREAPSTIPSTKPNATANPNPIKVLKKVCSAFIRMAAGYVESD
jgi:hypothetical protein